ncbi:MAG: alpha/beta hydrolase [Promethearchaeota archaeon]
MFLDDPKISSVVFFPRKIKFPNNLGSNIEALKFQINNEIQIGCIYYLKNKNLPTILMFHGNGEIALDYKYFFPLYHEINVNLAVVDFRGYGFSTGTPKYSSLILDALPIYNHFKNWMKEYGLKNSLFIQGRSLGSVCACEIGSENPKDLRGIIIESGFASIYNIMTRLFQVYIPENIKELLEKYSNDIKVKNFKKPALVIHGTEDWIIPCEEGNALFETIPDNVEKKLVLIKRAGHNNIFNFKKEYFTSLKEFIEKFK